MNRNYLESLTINNGFEESKLLFHSFLNSEDEFDKCFVNLYSFDYKLIFGSEKKNKFLFNVLKHYYHNDYYVRYSFINKVLKKSSAISFEELPVENSRVDLASINGKSVAYEIKSEFDNYERLEKQINDYSKCFESDYQYNL